MAIITTKEIRDIQQKNVENIINKAINDALNEGLNFAECDISPSMWHSPSINTALLNAGFSFVPNDKSTLNEKYGFSHDYDDRSSEDYCITLRIWWTL